MAIQIFSIAALIISAIFHEYAHGWTAHKLGDNTAKDAGRLTLNPLAHIDPFGSVILPILLSLIPGGFIIGYAKPVPYNPYNLRDQRWGDLKVAISGPLTNFILAVIFGIFARILLTFFAANPDPSLMYGSLNNSLLVMAIIMCSMNLLLMVFNLIPIPPLDGSKVLMSVLPYRWQSILSQIEPYGFFIILFLLYAGFFSMVISPIINLLFYLIIGAGN